MLFIGLVLGWVGWLVSIGLVVLVVLLGVLGLVGLGLSVGMGMRKRDEEMGWDGK